MKFCQICGRPLQDNEVCNCQSQPRQSFDDQRTVAASQAYPQPQPGPQPQQAPPRYQQAPQQRPAAPQYQQVPQRPAMQQPYYPDQRMMQRAPQGRFVKALKNIPVVFKSYWTNSDKLVDAAKKGKDWILPLLFIAILFFINLIFGICYFARMTDSNYINGLGFFKYTFFATTPFKFGFVLLGALIITIFSACLYINFRFFASSILSKKKPADAFTDALVEFGIHAMPVCLWLLLGALLSLATAWLAVPFMATAMAYYVVIGVSNTVKECGSTKNEFLRNIILAALVMLAIGLLTWMIYLICSMNGGGDYISVARRMVGV